MVTLTPLSIALGSIALLETGYLVHSYLADQVNMAEVRKSHTAAMTNRALEQDVEDGE